MTIGLSLRSRNKVRPADWRHYRRRQPPQATLFIRLSFEDKNALVRQAIKQTVSMTELVNTYITWGLENDRGVL